MKKIILIIPIILFLALVTFMIITEKTNIFIPLKTITSIDLTESQNNSILTGTQTSDATMEYKTLVVNSGKESGEVIIEAIDAFFQDYIDYPISLEDLIPKYLSEVPKTINAGEFYYFVNKADIYLVGFYLSSDNDKFSCTYSKKLDFWDCGGSVE